MENENGNNISIFEEVKTLDVKRACIDNSTFDDISACRMKIANANLSDLEIDGAQIGGAYIHNIGMPPQGHPVYDPAARQRPVRFEHCDLNSSTFTSSDLSSVSIDNCNTSGMKINGVLVEDLFQAYDRANG